MDYSERGVTFGSFISERRKERLLTREAVVRKGTRLGLSVRELNELEQDRLDPITRPNFEAMISCLAEIFEADVERLRALALAHDEAARKRKQLDERLAFGAVAFRARNERG